MAHNYRLVVHLDSGPMQAVTVNIDHPSEAMLVAQQYDGPAELWDGDRLLCTITRRGGVWVIGKG